MGVWGHWVFVASLFASLSAWGNTIDLTKYNWHSHSNNFILQKGSFQGDWPYQDDWQGLICDGFYHSDTNAKGRITDIHATVNNDLTLSVSLTGQSIVLSVDSSYKGDLSACFTLSLGHSVTIDSAQILASATVTDDPQSDKPKISVQVTSTNLGHVVYDTNFPDWLNNDITAGLNETMNAMWSTEIGEWISSVLSNQLNQSAHPNS